MKTRPSVIAVLTAAIALMSSPVFAARPIAEVRGDFYYDRDGNVLGHRDAALPEGFERRPMSHREKFQLMGIQLPEPATNLVPRRVRPKPLRVDDRDGLLRDKVIVKFVDEVTARLRDETIRIDGAPDARVESLLARYPEATVHRCFDTDERILEENKATGERISGQELADLNNYFVLTLPTPSDRGVELANELLAEPIVETAYLQAPGLEPACPGDFPPTTPSWLANQNYRTAAPSGLDIDYAWSYHVGGQGAGPGYWIADLEWGWCTDHEDLDFDASDVLNGLEGSSDVNHGTSVLGIYGACNNNYGTTGLTPAVTLKALDFDSELTISGNIQAADDWLISGEIMLLEIQILGPDSDLTCICNCGQFEYVPVEWDGASYSAIRTAVANGITVVETAGNGSMDLDDSIYADQFNPVSHNSGAILVGAGRNSNHDPECWTNYGPRLDLHGYGGSIYSTGEGDLWDQPNCSQDYTNSFGGTSGAAAMIVGAASSLQGISKGKYGVTLSPGQIRESLAIGGTPQGGPTYKHIGPMPNMVEAINWIEPDVTAAFTPGGWSYPAIPRATNDTNGSYAPLQLAALPGNVAGTYWNWTEENAGYVFTPTVNNPHAGLFLDNWHILICLNTNMIPGQWQFCGNVGGPDLVKGGRHTVLSRADWANAENEWAEWNNDWSRQYIWSPLPLSVNVPVTRSFDPPMTSPGSGPYFNCEGFSGTTGSQYWYAFATMAADQSTDFDMALHGDLPLNIPQQGFGAALTTSEMGGWTSEFVILDLNIGSGGTYYASGINWSGTADKIVEFDQDQGTVGVPSTTGPYTLGPGEIVDLHEVYLPSSGQTRIQIQWLSGNANFGVSVHRSTSGFSNKWNPIPGGFADSPEPGSDAYVIVQPATTSYHGIVVWKNGPASLNESVTYNLIVSQLPNLTDATPPGWSGPIVPRDAPAPGPSDCTLSPTLDGSTSNSYFNFCTLNEGPNSVSQTWRSLFLVDDMGWFSPQASALGPGEIQLWQNQRLPGPYWHYFGGLHHLRTRSDDLNEVSEIFEGDNDFVDWFVWTPTVFSAGVPHDLYPVPSRPLGFGPYESCRGIRTPPFAGWQAVGITPMLGVDDLDLRVHSLTTGSKSGFGAYFASSSEGTPGSTEIILAQVQADYGVYSWIPNVETCYIEVANQVSLAAPTPGVTRYGPYQVDPYATVDLYFMQLGILPGGWNLNISLNNLGGDANLELRLFDPEGGWSYMGKFMATYTADAAGNGADEHLPATSFGTGPVELLIAVSKDSSGDLYKTARYELVFSRVGSVVDVLPDAPIPTALNLTSPRPNPFSREARMELSVPVNQGPASVSVYDLQGRRVALLAEGTRDPGYHLLVWNGRDDSGREVTSGVYFVRLESADFEMTKKLTLLR